jgi:hypothetical protein
MGRRCFGIVVESFPSVGLAVVDSMLPRRIKAFGSHAQAFPSKTAVISHQNDVPFPPHAGFKWFPPFRNSRGNEGVLQPSDPATRPFEHE